MCVCVLALHVATLRRASISFQTGASSTCVQGPWTSLSLYALLNVEQEIFPKSTELKALLGRLCISFFKSWMCSSVDTQCQVRKMKPGSAGWQQLLHVFSFYFSSEALTVILWFNPMSITYRGGHFLISVSFLGIGSVAGCCGVLLCDAVITCQSNSVGSTRTYPAFDFLLCVCAEMCIFALWFCLPAHANFWVFSEKNNKKTESKIMILKHSTFSSATPTDNCQKSQFKSQIISWL